MAVYIYKNIDDLSHGLADRISNLAREIITTHNRFTIALAGGNTPRKLFEVLSSPPYATSIDWAKVHIFWGDERLVPFDDMDNNAAMAYKYLIGKLPVAASNIHRIKTESPPEDAIIDYQKILESYFSKTEKSFDLVLLGLGSDGHTLSLFDINQQFNASSFLIHVVSKVPERISLTPNLVNRAKHIAYMVSGADKAEVIQDVMRNQTMIKYPAQLIKPENGEVEWFLDEAAASKIK